MTKNGKLVLGGVSLTKARPNKYDIEVMIELSEALGEILQEINFFYDAKFTRVSLILRYGLKNEGTPHYQRINKKYGDLPLAIELDTHELVEADREELKRLFMIATLKALIHAGQKYELPIEELKKLLNEQVAVS